MISESQARNLLLKCKSAWHEGNATEPAAMAMSDVVSELILYLVPEAGETTPLEEERSEIDAELDEEYGYEYVYG